MADPMPNPWKMATIGIAVVIATVLITGLVVANWSGKELLQPAAVVSRPPARQAGTPPRTTKSPQDVIEKALIGGAIGAGVGAAGGAIADGGKGAGKGAAIGGIVGATAGTVYGLQDKK